MPTSGCRAHLGQALSCLLGKLGNFHFYHHHHHPHTHTQKTPPRPLPSCLALSLKTGTDLVKKQEVMKTGLEQPNQVFFPPIPPSKFHDTSFTQTHKPPTHETSTETKMNVDYVEGRWRCDYATSLQPVMMKESTPPPV